MGPASVTLGLRRGCGRRVPLPTPIRRRPRALSPIKEGPIKVSRPTRTERLADRPGWSGVRPVKRADSWGRRRLRREREGRVRRVRRGPGGGRPAVSNSRAWDVDQQGRGRTPRPRSFVEREGAFSPAPIRARGVGPATESPPGRTPGPRSLPARRQRLCSRRPCATRTTGFAPGWMGPLLVGQVSNLTLSSGSGRKPDLPALCRTQQPPPNASLPMGGRSTGRSMSRPACLSAVSKAFAKKKSRPASPLRTFGTPSSNTVRVVKLFPPFAPPALTRIR